MKMNYSGWTQISRRCFHKCGGLNNPNMRMRLMGSVVTYYHVKGMA